MCRGTIVILVLLLGVAGLVLRSTALHARYLDRVTSELNVRGEWLRPDLGRLRLVDAVPPAGGHSKYV